MTTSDGATVSTTDGATVTTADTTADGATADTTAKTAADATTADTTADTIADTTADARAASDSATTFLLGLVLDEVDFGFGGLSGSSSGDGDVGLFVGFLDQHVDEGLLFVLSLGGDDGCNGCGRSWRLNEDDLVVLLGNASAAYDGSTLFFGFWGWDVDVDVLLNDSATAEASATAETSTAAETGAASETRASAEARASTEARTAAR